MQIKIRRDYYMMHNFNTLYIIYSLYCVLPISTLHMTALFGPYFTGLQWSRVYIVEMHNASNSSTWSCLERRKESRKESRFARRIVKHLARFQHRYLSSPFRGNEDESDIEIRLVKDFRAKLNFVGKNESREGNPFFWGFHYF